MSGRRIIALLAAALLGGTALAQADEAGDALFSISGPGLSSRPVNRDPIVFLRRPSPAIGRRTGRSDATSSHLPPALVGVVFSDRP